MRSWTAPPRRARARDLPSTAAHLPDPIAGSWDIGEVAMAQNVTVVLEAHLTGGPAEQTVRFSSTARIMRST
jgi:hypothetical protein